MCSLTGKYTIVFRRGERRSCPTVRARVYVSSVLLSVHPVLSDAHMHQTQSNGARARPCRCFRVRASRSYFPKYMRRLFMEHRCLPVPWTVAQTIFAGYAARRLNKSYSSASTRPAPSRRKETREYDEPHASGQMKSYFRNMSLPICDVCRGIRASSSLTPPFPVSFPLAFLAGRRMNVRTRVFCNLTSRTRDRRRKKKMYPRYERVARSSINPGRASPR